MKVVLLGADDFIGRHILFHLHAQGIAVTAAARRPARLAAPTALPPWGFRSLQADLTDLSTRHPSFWRSDPAGRPPDQSRRTADRHHRPVPSRPPRPDCG